jgi:magnesium-transporting ATPase (P-type)
LKPANTKPPDIATASVPDALAALHVNPDTGLARAEVDVRRKEHGYNEVAPTKGHPVLKFLGKFWGISAWMLELIMVLSAVLKNFSDLAVVGALLVINAVLGFMQERRAAGVVEALRKRLQVSARVRRDSSWQVIPARELVPGDIIPADLKLLTGALTVDQSALTGESKDVDKAPGKVLSSGSVVRRGEGNGVVMLTGAKTYFGRTTELVQEARPKLHIEAVVAKVVRWLFVIVGALLCVVVVLSLIRGAPLIEMVPLMLVLLMSAVPVALPVIFTVSMAVGSKELAKRGVLVTRLSAAEDAATMDVLCVDKTGTITMNQLAVTGVIPLEHATEADALLAGALASQQANQDPIDLAFLAAAKERHIFDNLPKVTPVSFAPFDAKNWRTEAVVEQGRTIYQRILTWIINKISRTILKAAFVSIAFVVTGKFVVTAFAMLLLVFMTDFAKISLATDNVRPSKKPETWNIGGFITVSVVLGVAMLAETLLLLWIGWSHFGLATNTNALYTFSFLMLLYFAVFSVASARERSWFGATLPSKTFLAALAADAITGTVLTFVGLRGLMPLPWWQTLAIFVYAMASCLVLNDAVKVAMIKWRVPKAVAGKPVDVTPQIAKRAYELYELRGRENGRAVQDWEQAEREIRKDEPHR